MKYLFTLGLATLAVSLAIPAAFAQATPATADTTAATADPKPEFFGYVGVYYGYDFNNPAGLTRPGFIYSETCTIRLPSTLPCLGRATTATGCAAPSPSRLALIRMPTTPPSLPSSRT